MKALILFLFFSPQAFAGENLQKPSTPREVMGAVAEIYGELLTEEKIRQYKHEKIIKPIDANIIGDSAFRTLAEMFIVISQNGFSVNAMDFIRSKNSINMPGVQPTIVEHNFDAPKIFGVYIDGELKGYTFGQSGSRPEQIQNAMDFPNGVKTLYLSIGGSIIKNGLGRTKRPPRKRPSHLPAPAPKPSPFEILGGLSCRSIL